MEKRSKKSLVQSLHDRSGRPRVICRMNSRDTISSEYLDDILQRIERIENEMIRYNKVLTMYIDRIEDLETSIEKLNKNFQIFSLNQSNKINNNDNSRSIGTNSNNSSSNSNTLDSNQSQNQNQKLSTWMRFTNFFKHRPSLDTLKKKNIYQNEPCFDTEIENVIKHERYRTIPKIVVECIEIIETEIKTTPTDGLYRTSGNYAEIQKLRFLIDSNDYECLKKVKDVHTIVGVLKLFFREIKSPLIKSSEMRVFIGASKERTTSKYKTDILQKLLKTLPEVNRDTLSYFLKHLCRLTRTPLQFVNARSLSISLTPTIFHTTYDYHSDIHVTMKESEILADCLEFMIEYCDKIFELIIIVPFETRQIRIPLLKLTLKKLISVPYKRVSRRLTKCISCPKLNV